MKMRMLYVALFLTAVSCSHNQAPVAVSSAEPAPAVVGDRKISSEPEKRTIPVENKKVAEEITKNCIKGNVMQTTQQIIIDACECLTRNHLNNLNLAELKSVLKVYKTKKKVLQPKDLIERNLWSYDADIAERCAEDSSYEHKAESAPQ